MIKRLNIKNIAVVLVILALLHFGIGLFVSPKIGEFIVRQINQYSEAKISVEKVNVWPLTLSISLKNVKIFDPKDTNDKIAEIKLASVYISPLGLLSKRLVISEVKISGANINLEGEPDGTFNIERLSKPKTSGKPLTLAGGIGNAIQQKDWFARGYDLLKKKAAKADAGKITKTVNNLPKGRRVYFKLENSYLMEIKRLVVVNSSLDLKHQDGRSVQVENAYIEIGNAAFDPELGLRLGKAEIEGNIKNAGIDAGSLRFLYQGVFSRGKSRIHFNCRLKQVDVGALSFIYERSLPVKISKGVLDLDSDAVIDNGNINSFSKVTLSNHELLPKELSNSSDVIMPLPLVCDILNNISPLSMDIPVSGTLDRPDFKEFTRSLAKLVKPNLKNIGETIKNEVLKKGITGILEELSGKKQGR